GQVNINGTELKGSLLTFSAGSCALVGYRRTVLKEVCKNNATCVKNGTKPEDIYCCCQPGFKGERCETEINECESDPCQNNGTCEEFVDAFECKCQPGFSGMNCEIPPPCLSEPCQNNGTCRENSSSFSCVCLDGFTGTFCEIKSIDVCDDNICENNSTCKTSNVIDEYLCECMDGFNGTYCEYKIPKDPCEPDPCLETALCLSNGTNFKCKCLENYFGANCSVMCEPHDDCEGHYTCA
ncbi:unnamed protein product, partial [Owenia fusiformis]